MENLLSNTYYNLPSVNYPYTHTKNTENQNYDFNVKPKRTSNIYSKTYLSRFRKPGPA